MNQKVAMLRTAIPYFDLDTGRLLETVARVEELRAIVTGGENMTEVAVQCQSGKNVDVEGLLQAIREFCDDREKGIIDMFLNFLMMKDMMSVMQPTEGGDTGDMMETILSMMGGF